MIRSVDINNKGNMRCLENLIIVLSYVDIGMVNRIKLKPYISLYELFLFLCH